VSTVDAQICIQPFGSHNNKKQNPARDSGGTYGTEDTTHLIYKLPCDTTGVTGQMSFHDRETIPFKQRMHT
jgi:hypothetical protein